MGEQIARTVVTSIALKVALDCCRHVAVRPTARFATHWRPVDRIAGGDGTHRCPQARVERRVALRQPGGISGPRSRRCWSFHQ